MGGTGHLVLALHVGLVSFGNEVPQVIGAVLPALGFAGCAVVLWRRHRPTLER